MCFTMDERLVPDPVNSLVITFDKAKAGMSASEAADKLAAGDPCILAVVEGDRLAVVMDVLEDSEILLIAERLRGILKR
jgi:hypothetical protein